MQSTARGLVEALASGVVNDVDCSRCRRVGAVPYMYASLVGSEFCLCPPCRDMKEAESRGGGVGGDDQGVSVERMLHAVGLSDQHRIVDALGISDSDRDGFLAAEYKPGKIAVRAVKRYLATTKRMGLLILSGVSGVGKSTAAAWAAWDTQGAYHRRASWSALGVRGKDEAEIERAIRCRGVVVLDNALGVTWEGTPEDSPYEIEVLFRVCDERHQAGRGTIITTQADREQIETAYGDRGRAIVRRALEGLAADGGPDTGGWIDCAGRRH